MSRSITLQAFNPKSNAWEIRNAFTVENRKLNALINERVSADIIEDMANTIKRAANDFLNRWRAYPDGLQLRVHDTESERRPRSLGAAALNTHDTWAGLGGMFSRIDHRNYHYRNCECAQCNPSCKSCTGTLRAQCITHGCVWRDPSGCSVKEALS